MKNGAQTPAFFTVAWAPRWYSASTWIALAIAFIYIVFTFGFPLIPIVVIAGSMDDLVFYVAPVIGLVIWLLAMSVRIFVRKIKGQLIWTALRYGVIAFGTAGLLVMIVGSTTPGYIRKTAQFQRQMRHDADIPAIRAWTASYQPAPDAHGNVWGTGIFVPEEQWPDSVARLRPEMVMYAPSNKILEIVFGGGFGHWGLCVGPKGTPPSGDYTLPLEDGAWVWHEIQ